MGVQVTERQLHLFKSRQQKGLAPPAPTEFASQCFLVDVIRRWIDPQWRFCHVPLGEERDHKIDPKTGKRWSPTGSRLSRLGVVAGWPDLQFAGPNRQMVFLELKRRGGRLSEAQAAMRAHLEDCGFGYLCTDSVDHAIEWLKDVGILRGGFTVQ